MEGRVRVWLEPAYDHGRTGAWMLDWPGAFCWGVGFRPVQTVLVRPRGGQR